MDKPLIVRQLPYCKNSTVYFETIKSKPFPVYLDSCADTIESGCYDIISASPEKWITAKDGQITIRFKNGSCETTDDGFTILQQELGNIVKIDQSLPSLPFYGGAIGYFSYDLGRTLEDIPSLIADDLQIPDMEFGIYNWAIVVDHKQKQTFFVSKTKTEYIYKLIAEITSICNSSKNIIPSVISDYNTVDQPRWNCSKEEYLQGVNLIKNYIYDGDCYQVNFTQRIAAHYLGSEWELYKILRKQNPAPFSAYLKTIDFTILSSSPEQFVSLNNLKVVTKPIKGTAKRSDCDEQDNIRASELANCDKNQAENLMIVDLLRNDLGKVCNPGSIKVEKLFDVESFEHIHHLVSTISGTLNEQFTAIDVIKNCFPGGSITGAPKIRSMQIIEELEKQRRGVYCGAIGYISFNGYMNTNIAIRTAITKNNTIYYWAGGGIVSDSIPENEYEEMLTKSSAFLNALS
ncbi:MAG: aminodeoxychorismate synthase component I [Gammaproteobacteria bacterium]|nr:MAG: aminodeoxychorismate synthase component I [Gammaproteobacteria bacterium]